MDALLWFQAGTVAGISRPKLLQFAFDIRWHPLMGAVFESIATLVVLPLDRIGSILVVDEHHRHSELSEMWMVASEGRVGWLEVEVGILQQEHFLVKFSVRRMSGFGLWTYASALLIKQQSIIPPWGWEVIIIVIIIIILLLFARSCFRIFRCVVRLCIKACFIHAVKSIHVSMIARRCQAS